MAASKDTVANLKATTRRIEQLLSKFPSKKGSPSKRAHLYEPRLRRSSSSAPDVASGATKIRPRRFIPTREERLQSAGTKVTWSIPPYSSHSSSTSSSESGQSSARAFNTPSASSDSSRTSSVPSSSRTTPVPSSLSRPSSAQPSASDNPCNGGVISINGLRLCKQCAEVNLKLLIASKGVEADGSSLVTSQNNLGPLQTSQVQPQPSLLLAFYIMVVTALFTAVTGLSQFIYGHYQDITDPRFLHDVAAKRRKLSQERFQGAFPRPLSMESDDLFIPGSFPEADEQLLTEAATVPGSHGASSQATKRGVAEGNSPTQETSVDVDFKPRPLAKNRSPLKSIMKHRRLQVQYPRRKVRFVPTTSGPEPDAESHDPPSESIADLLMDNLDHFSLPPEAREAVHGSPDIMPSAPAISIPASSDLLFASPVASPIASRMASPMAAPVDPSVFITLGSPLLMPLIPRGTPFTLDDCSPLLLPSDSPSGSPSGSPVGPPPLDSPPGSPLGSPLCSPLGSPLVKRPVRFLIPSSSRSVIEEGGKDRLLGSGELEEFGTARSLRLRSVSGRQPEQQDEGNPSDCIEQLVTMPSMDALRISDDSKATIAEMQVESAAQLAKEAERAREEERQAKEERERLEREARIARGPRVPVVAPLCHEWDSILADVVTRPVNDQSLATTSDRVPLRQRDFSTLIPPTEWLNDEIVNGALGWLAKEINLAAGITDCRRQGPKCVALNSFFWPRLEKDCTRTQNILARQGVDYTNFLRVETILIPVCYNHHWTLVVVRPREKTVGHFDSLGSNASRVNPYLAMQWIKDVLKDSFFACQWRVVHERTPRQTNGHDCGVHVITNAMCFALGLKPMDCYTPEDMPLQRKRIAAMLLCEQGFSGDFDLWKPAADE